ncbi:MAG TPA: hypothetical protein VLL28_06620, partial [Hyphomicrobiaceae bacterium]|nr:hypothetical protein [Hyphomicrobiaceae bacterium]
VNLLVTPEKTSEFGVPRYKTWRSHQDFTCSAPRVPKPSRRYPLQSGAWALGPAGPRVQSIGYVCHFV